MIRPVVLAGVALGAITGAFFLGRSTAPTKLIEHTKTIALTGSSTTAVASQEAAVDKGVQWKTRTIYRKGGEVEVVRTVVQHDTKTEKAATAQAKVEYRTDVQERLKLVETARSNWAAGVSAGLGLDGRLRYQGEIDRRLIGGLWVTGGVDVSTKSVLVGLKLEF